MKYILILLVLSFNNVFSQTKTNEIERLEWTFNTIYLPGGKEVSENYKTTKGELQHSLTKGSTSRSRSTKKFARLLDSGEVENFIAFNTKSQHDIKLSDEEVKMLIEMSRIKGVHGYPIYDVTEIDVKKYLSGNSVMVDFDFISSNESVQEMLGGVIDGAPFQLRFVVTYSNKSKRELIIQDNLVGKPQLKNMRLFFSYYPLIDSGTLFENIPLKRYFNTENKLFLILRYITIAEEK
jgi:hypothetical protein